MSLLNEAYTLCTRRIETQVDSVGGVINTWTDGAQFYAAIVETNSQNPTVAEQETEKQIFSVITKRETAVLMFNDVFKRNSDGKVFRVLSDGDEKKTPLSAGLDMRIVTAEEWHED